MNKKTLKKIKKLEQNIIFIRLILTHYFLLNSLIYGNDFIVMKNVLLTLRKPSSKETSYCNSYIRMFS